MLRRDYAPYAHSVTRRPTSARNIRVQAVRPYGDSQSIERKSRFNRKTAPQLSESSTLKSRELLRNVLKQQSRRRYAANGFAFVPDSARRVVENRR